MYEARPPAHWNYFLTLDDDVVRLSRYLELSSANFSAYSVELARILLAAASEIDVVAKQLCTKVSGASKATSINQYRKEILVAHPEITSAYVFIPRYGLGFQPWKEWGECGNPRWWAAYNSVKHHRHKHFSEASLGNALCAVAGLFVLILFFFEHERQFGYLHPDPALFRVGVPFSVDRLAWGTPATVYRLPGERE